MQPVTYAQANALVTGLTKMGLKYKRPVVMGEWGVKRSQPVTNIAGTQVIQPTDPGYASARYAWNKMVLDACYVNGCAGSNVWMGADWSDNDFNVNLYKPYGDAVRDAPLVALLKKMGTKYSP